MGKSIDLQGMRFGRLFVVEKYGKAKNGSIIWKCRCDCGKETMVTSCNLRSGSTNACGCLHNEFISSLSKKHGLSHTRLHGIWRGIKGRCLNHKNSSYQNYGGRGIKICEEWKDNFENFYEWAMSNGYKDDLSIDRIDVNNGYFPENCRWVTDEVQSRNRRNNRKYSHDGETKTLSEWAREYGIDRKTLSDRMDKFGWDFEKALTTKAGASYDRRGD